MLGVSSAFRVLTSMLVAMTLGAGCQTLADAKPVIGRADLVNDLAARLDRAGELTYSADYRLPEGRTASISQAQRPLRAAYTYPGGKVTVTIAATTECDTTKRRPTCTVTPPPSPSIKPAAAVFTETRAHGLVTPPVVINLLNAAALDGGAIIEQSDTTIAGRHATCVDVAEVANAAASSFAACITTEGVLGSFAGVVDGTPIDIAMSRYRDSVDASSFELPPGAGIVDHRPGAG